MDDKKQNPEENGLVAYDASAIEQRIKELTHELILADDSTETRSIIEKYNAYLVKKSAIRTGKLEKLYDEIVEQMLLRFKNRGGEFSNKDLLDYLNSVQAALDKSVSKLNNTDETPVQYGTGQTQVNINVLEGFTHDQKTNIADAIKSILQQSASNTYYPGEYEETPEENISEDNPNDKEGEDNN